MQGCRSGASRWKLIHERRIDEADREELRRLWTAAIEGLLRQEQRRFPAHTEASRRSPAHRADRHRGGVMQARAHRSLAPFDAAVDQLRQSLCSADDLSSRAPVELGGRGLIEGVPREKHFTIGGSNLFRPTNHSGRFAEGRTRLAIRPAMQSSDRHRSRAVLEDTWHQAPRLPAGCSPRRTR